MYCIIFAPSSPRHPQIEVLGLPLPTHSPIQNNSMELWQCDTSWDQFQVELQGKSTYTDLAVFLLVKKQVNRYKNMQTLQGFMQLSFSTW